MRINEILTEAVKQRLDPKCWKGKHKEGTKIKGGVRVNNCVPNESVNEDNDRVDPIITKALERLQPGLEGSGPGSALYTAAKEALALEFGLLQARNNSTFVAYLNQLQDMYAQHHSMHEEFDLIESIIESLAERNQVDAEAIWEDLESLSDDELYVFATTTPVMEDWQKANKKDKTDGMSQKAVNAYKREHPGSKLKTAVTTKPSKLKKGSKASKRRSSYCSRSKGQMKMHSISCAKTPDKAICKARRRWNCE